MVVLAKPAIKGTNAWRCPFIPGVSVPLSHPAMMIAGDVPYLVFHYSRQRLSAIGYPWGTAADYDASHYMCWTTASGTNPDLLSEWTALPPHAHVWRNTALIYGPLHLDDQDGLQDLFRKAKSSDWRQHGFWWGYQAPRKRPAGKHHELLNYGEMPANWYVSTPL